MDVEIRLDIIIIIVSRLWKGWVLKHTASLNREWDVTSGEKTNHGTVMHVPEEFVNALAELP
jgi:hypothetical protein